MALGIEAREVRVTRGAAASFKPGLAPTEDGRIRLNVRPKLDRWTGEGTRAGDFHIPDFGAGHVNFQRLRTRAGDFYHFQLVNDLVDEAKVNSIKRATLVMLNPESAPRYGKRRMDEIGVTMQRFKGDELPAAARKAFGVALPTATVRSAAGLGGVEFYVNIEMADGTKHAVNLNGQPFSNFLIPNSALRGSLPPPPRAVAKRTDSPRPLSTEELAGTPPVYRLVPNAPSAVNLPAEMGGGPYAYELVSPNTGWQPGDV
jgi:hypothetical protein